MHILGYVDFISKTNINKLYITKIRGKIGRILPRISMIYRLGNLSHDREQRIKLQNKLIKKYNMPLISITFNYLNKIKVTDVVFNIVQTIDSIISDIFSPYIFFKLLRETSEGYNVIIIIDRDVMDIKKISLEIENKHVLGDCVNIDVFNKEGRKISRNDLGYLKRKCYICNDDIQNCINNKRHSEDEVMKCAIKKYNQYMGECMRNKNKLVI